jgi:hypothetical protein
LYVWEHSEKYGNTCNICGEEITKLSDLELDHTISLSKGGKKMALAHRDCNRMKGSKNLKYVQTKMGFKTPKTRRINSALPTQAIEVYSPIHTMIVRINNEIPREQALQGSVGVWVRASLIDFNNISAVFNQHIDKFSDKDLKMWIDIEKEIKAGNGFFLGNDRQKWFDELEAEYNLLKQNPKGYQRKKTN